MEYVQIKCGDVIRILKSLKKDKSPGPDGIPPILYQQNGEHLKSVSHQRDLGVIVDETLKPHHQCTKATKSANSIMRAIKASFMNITPTLFDKLYGTFIHPHLEYSFHAWRPWLRKDIKTTSRGATPNL